MVSCAICGQEFSSHRIIYSHIVQFHQTESWATFRQRSESATPTPVPNHSPQSPRTGPIAFAGPSHALSAATTGSPNAGTLESMPGPSSACKILAVPNDSVVNPRKPGFLYSRDQLIEKNNEAMMNVRSVHAIGRAMDGDLKCLIQQEYTVVAMSAMNNCVEALADFTVSYSKGNVRVRIHEDGTVMFSPLYESTRDHPQIPPPEPQGKLAECFCNLFCLKQFKGRNELLQHARSYHKDNQLAEIFSCNACRITFRTRDEAETHITECRFKLEGKKAILKRTRITFATQQEMLLRHMDRISTIFYRQRAEYPGIEPEDNLNTTFAELMQTSRVHTASERLKRAALTSQQPMKKIKVSNPEPRPRPTPSRKNPPRAARPKSVRESPSRSLALVPTTPPVPMTSSTGSSTPNPSLTLSNLPPLPTVPPALTMTSLVETPDVLVTPAASTSPQPQSVVVDLSVGPGLAVAVHPAVGRLPVDIQPGAPLPIRPAQSQPQPINRRDARQSVWNYCTLS